MPRLAFREVEAFFFLARSTAPPFLIWLNDRKGRRRNTSAMSEATVRARNCRLHAEQCRAWSDLATHHANKREFMKVAEQWEKLAQEIEEIERIRIFVPDADGLTRPSRTSATASALETARD